jgi:hypothetical protein
MTKNHGKYFPHNTRKYTAWSAVIITLLIVLNIFFVLANIILADNQKNIEASIKQDILKNPLNPKNYERLAQVYFNDDKIAAKNEYLLAEELFQNINENVLGINVSPWQNWLELNNDKNKMIQELLYWQNISKNFPDYYYSRLKLTNLYFKLGMKNEFDKSLNSLKVEKPYFELVKSFELLN